MEFPRPDEEDNISQNWESMIAFVIMNATMAVSLAVSLLSLMTRQHQLRRGTILQRLCALENSGENSTSRKRRRDDEDDWKHFWLFNQVVQSFVMRKREIQCWWYIKPRSIQWFYLFIDFVPHDDPERFKEFFRVSPTMFYAICDMVHDDMLTNPPLAFCTLPNRRLTIERQVAIALRRLCTGDQFLGISELFGVSCPTAIKVTWKFIQAVNARGRRLIKWPTGAELDEVKGEFLDRWGFPNCCGAIDGTHFPVELPTSERSQDYFDFKKKTSVSMQAIVELQLRFLHVVAGWPGSIQDTRLLRVSTFYRDVEYRRVKLQGLDYNCQDGETILWEYIVGDAGYPLYPWLMVPFARGLSDEHDLWNHRHSQARMAVERAFGQLKGTWRILSRILWKPKKQRIGPMIYCCCILHNYLIERGEHFSPELLRGITPHPGGYAGVHVPRREYMGEGPKARDNLLNEVTILSEQRRTRRM